MNINLNNYESFFLLYVDNELSAAERKSVEEFLGNYPYLQGEMDQLKETVLPMESKNFDFKAGLLKPVLTEEAQLDNLLLHLDNELGGEQKLQLEQELLKDSELQKEWALLKRTKLDPTELVAFPDKTILYRNESGRLAISRFVRLAIAAAVVGAGIFLGMNLLDKNVALSDEMAVNPVQPVPGGVNSTGTAVDSSTSFATTASEEIKAKRATSGNLVIDQPVAAAKKIVQDNPNLENLKMAKKEIATATSNELPNKKPVENDDVERVIRRALPSNQEIVRIDLPENNESRNSSTIASVKNMPTISDVNIQQVENLFARTAAFDNDDNSDNHIFMMDEDKVSRSKAAGFLKKLKRTVERTTKIKPGNSLRIAGFEFAVK